LLLVQQTAIRWIGFSEDDGKVMAANAAEL
jgi:hypothetical protein